MKQVMTMATQWYYIFHNIKAIIIVLVFANRYQMVWLRINKGLLAYRQRSLGIHGSVRCCRDYYTITSTYSTYKKGSLNWTYQPTTSNHAYSKVDMFPISEQHCPYILYPANSSSTYSTLKQKISRATYSTIAFSMLPHWKSTICCLLSTAIQLDFSILKTALKPYTARVFRSF